MAAETTMTWTASREIVATVVGRVDGKRVGAGRINGGILRGRICGRIAFSNRLEVGTSVMAEIAVESRRLQQSTKRLLVANVGCIDQAIQSKIDVTLRIGQPLDAVP